MIKRIAFIVPILLLAIMESNAQNVEPKLMAVYVVGGVHESYKKVVYSSIVKTVNADASFKVVERADEILSTVITEVDYQNSGMVDQNQIINLGRQAGAAYIFAVDLSSILGEIYATGRIINAEDGIVIASSDVSDRIDDMNSLKSLACAIATNTIAQLPENKAKNKRLDEYRDYLNKIKLRGPFTSAYKLSKFLVPSGYRIANYDEIKRIMEAKKALGETCVENVAYDINTKYAGCERYILRFSTPRISVSISDSGSGSVRCVSGTTHRYSCTYNCDERGVLTYDCDLGAQYYVYCIRL